MSEALLLTVHWLHVATATIWAGGLAAFALVVWPWLLSRPAPEAKAAVQAMDRTAAKVLGASGGSAVLLGILRGTVFGPVQSFEAWYGTRYGWLMTIAFLLFIAIGVVYSRLQRRMDTHVWPGAEWHPGAARLVWRTNIVMLAILGMLLACMALLRLGV
jgi:putative copper export protein